MNPVCSQFRCRRWRIRSSAQTRDKRLRPSRSNRRNSCTDYNDLRQMTLAHRTGRPRRFITQEVRKFGVHRRPLSVRYPCTINFAGGSIAGRPLCCQQRPVPRTRREQGVPFFVRAPQVETISSGSVGRSLSAPSGPKRAASLGGVPVASDGLASDGFAWDATSTADAKAGASATRLMTSGGSAGRAKRPAT